MKKSNILVMLSALFLAGCNNPETSSSNNVSTSSSTANSSTVVSSTTSSSNSSSSISNSTSSSSLSSSSSSIDKTNWILDGEEGTAINNPTNWYYWADQNWCGSLVNVTNALYLEEELYFGYELVSGNCWFGAQLFYHDSSILEGDSYTVSFKLSSPSAGNITVNGEVVTLKEGLNTIEVTRTLPGVTSAALSIQFGTIDGGLFADKANFVIRQLNIQKNLSLNVKEVLENAIQLNNYTIELVSCDWGQTGLYKFFEKAAYFQTFDGGTYDEYRGFAENDEGVFGFKSLKKGTISPNTYYYKDANDEIIKGLYSTREAIDFVDSKGESLGVPSLHQLDLSAFDFTLINGEKESISSRTTLKVFGRMGGETINTLFYSGVSKASVKLLDDGSLEFELSNKVSDKCVYKLYNIGTTADEMIEGFIASSEFGPDSMGGDIVSDPVVEEMLTLIDNGNYTVLKPDGTYFYMNDKYSYMESKDENGLVSVSGYIHLDNGIFRYVIIDGELIVEDSFNYMEYNVESVNGLDGINSGNVQYFLVDNAYCYTYNATDGTYDYEPSAEDYSYISYSAKWFDQSATGCNLISLLKMDNDIIISSEMVFSNDLGEETTEWKNLLVSNIGSTTVEVLENYLASLEA